MIPNCIDVSIYQKNNDFKKSKDAGILAVIIRAGQKNYVDGEFKKSITNAINNGMPVGIYWFSEAGTIQEAINEATLCIQTIAPYKISLPVYFDWEYYSYDQVAARGIKITKNLVTSMAVAFCQTIQNAGYVAGVYSNPDYFSRYIDRNQLNGFSIWTACWGTKNPGNCDLWQYGVGRVAGINGDVDCDLINNKGIINVEPTPTPTPTPQPQPEAEFKSGDIVTIKKGAKYYGTNTTVPALILSKQWIVSTVNGDRVVLDKSTDGTMSIASAFYAKDLTNVRASKQTATKQTTTSTELKVGDKVKMEKNAPVYGTNIKFAFYVYPSTLYVRAIFQNRITVSFFKTGAVTGMVDRKYLKKV